MVFDWMTLKILFQVFVLYNSHSLSWCAPRRIINIPQKIDVGNTFIFTILCKDMYAHLKIASSLASLYDLSSIFFFSDHQAFEASDFLVNSYQLPRGIFRDIISVMFIISCGSLEGMYRVKII